MGVNSKYKMIVFENKMVSVSYNLVSTPADLAALCALILSDLPEKIGLDCEFNRRTTYWPELCLVQISVGKNIFLIDPFSTDINQLFSVLRHPQILKVAHAALQDCEIFNHIFGVPPSPMFDTQIAALFLRFGHSIGYSALHEMILGVGLDKSQQATDWSIRPLTSQQLIYAAQDVAHLDAIHTYCITHLKDRLPWALEEMLKLSLPATYAPSKEDLWQKVKCRVPLAKLPTRKKMLLQMLCAWREEVAQAQNVSRGRVIGDDIMERLLLKPPKTLETLEKMTSPLYAPVIWEMMEKARENELVRLKMDTLRIPKNKGQLYADSFELWQKIAAQEDIPAFILTSRQEIAALLENPRLQTPLTTGWRHTILGQQILSLIPTQQEAE